MPRLRATLDWKKCECKMVENGGNGDLQEKQLVPDFVL